MSPISGFSSNDRAGLASGRSGMRSTKPSPTAHCPFTEVALKVNSEPRLQIESSTRIVSVSRLQSHLPAADDCSVVGAANPDAGQFCQMLGYEAMRERRRQAVLALALFPDQLCQLRD